MILADDHVHQSKIAFDCCLIVLLNITLNIGTVIDQDTKNGMFLAEFGTKSSDNTDDNENKSAGVNLDDSDYVQSDSTSEVEQSTSAPIPVASNENAIQEAMTIDKDVEIMLNMDDHQHCLLVDECKTTKSSEINEKFSLEGADSNKALKALYETKQNSNSVELTDAHCRDDASDDNDSYTSDDYETEESVDNEIDIVEEAQKQLNMITQQQDLDHVLFNSANITTVERNGQHNCQLPNDHNENRSDDTSQPHRLNQSTTTARQDATVNRDVAIEMLDKKVISVLHSDCYDTEVNYVRRNLIVNILLVGAARIGKSSLVNALTGNKINLARTSSSLQRCTDVLGRYEVQCPLLDDVSENERSKIYIWDTKGIEDWDQQRGAMTMFQLIDKTRPICVIFCASPGSYANLTQVQGVLDYCIHRNILCAAVLTNMWSGKYGMSFHECR